MTTLIIDSTKLAVPSEVTDLESFRRWVDEPDFPETGHIWWLRGGVWADMSKEQVFTHIAVKGEIFRVLANLMAAEKLGIVLTDGLLITNEEADLSGKPDATFISHERWEAGHVEFVPGRKNGFTEVRGSPDMVLEVVSASSEEKDFVLLRDAYHIAGVLEYWLVDARREPPAFEILRRRATGFVATRKQSGWMKSEVFGKSFRFGQTTDKFGGPQFQLEVR